MKTNHFRTASLAVLIFLGTLATYAAENARSTQMKLGYTVGNLGLNLGYSFKLIIKGAIQLPAGELNRLSGASITKLRIAVGNNLSEQNNYVFITDDLNGEFLYQQPVDRLEYGWNEISLDKPFEIDGRELFVGYRYESAGETLSLDGESDNNLANWIYISQTDENGGQWSHQSGGALNIQAVVEGDNLPQCDVEINRNTIRTYAGVNQSTPLWGVVRNLGAATVTSLDVDISVDGEKVTSHTIDGLSISSGELDNVHLGDLTFDSNNICDVTVDITAVNGESDLRPGDNSLTVSNIIVRRDYTPRKVMLEHFSTMNCPNCPNAHTAIEDAMRFRNDIIHVVHHAGFGTDPLTIKAAEAYVWFYSDGAGSGSTYAPAAMLDRTNMSAYGATNGDHSTPGPVFSPRRDNLGSLIDKRLSTPALLTVNIANNYESKNRTLKVTVDGHIPNGSADRLSVKDPRLTVMIIEDSIPGPQMGVTVPLSGQYIHDCVLRNVLTDVWGDAVRFSDNGQYESKEYTTVIPADWNTDKLRIVAFVSDFSTHSSNGCQILNAEEAILHDKTGISSPSIPENSAFSWHPQVANGLVSLPSDCLGARLYSISGVLVSSAAAGAPTLSTDNASRGVYIIIADTNAGPLSAKIVL